MTIVIKDILQLNPLAESYFLCGESGAENAISTVTVMDVPNIIDWLQGQELLLTSFALNDWLDMEKVALLKEKQIAGFVTKKHYCADLSPEMIRALNEANIAVIIAPDHCAWRTVLQSIMEIIIAEQNCTISDIFQLHGDVMRLLLKNFTIKDICDTAQATIECPCAIVDDMFTLMGQSSTMDWTPVVREMAKNPERYSYSTMLSKDMSEPAPYINIAMEKDGIPLYIRIFPLCVRDTLNYGYLLLADAEPRQNGLSFLERIKINQIVLVSMYGIIHTNEIMLTNRNYYAFFLDKLTNGDITTKEISMITRSLGKNKFDRYYLLLMEVDYGNFDAVKPDEYHQFQVKQETAIINALKKEVPDYLQNILLFYRGTQLWFFIPPDVCDVTDTAEKLRKIIHRYTASREINLGISAPHSLTEARLAIEEASLAFRIAKEAPKEACCRYEDLGILTYFHKNSETLDHHFLMRLYERLILPLAEYDRIHSTELLHTLKVYFQQDASQIKTSDILFIHKNTLSGRLKKIEALLERNLSDMDTLLELNLALKYSSLFSGGGK